MIEFAPLRLMWYTNHPPSGLEDWLTATSIKDRPDALIWEADTM